MSSPPYHFRTSRILYSQGTTIGGDGFMISTQVRNELMAANRRNGAVIRPFLNGEFFNNSIDFTPQRYVIDFGVMELAEATSYKEPFAVLEALVKPYREKLTKQVHEARFWLHWDKREKFYNTIRKRDRVIVCVRHTPHLAFDFVLTDWIFSEAVKVFDIQSFADFAVLQSTFHESWARKYSSTIGMGLRYSTSDAFDTFPFPSAETDALDRIGSIYQELRRDIMNARRVGLTGFYNLVHDSEAMDKSIIRMREVCVQLDLTVATAYDWYDLDLAHDFHKTRQGIRYTISEAARREILDRLLALNHRRHTEEQVVALAATAPLKRGRKLKDSGNQTTLDM